MAKAARNSGQARGTGSLAAGATAALAARVTAPLAEPPPGWLAPAIAAAGLLGAALMAVGIVWHQTRLELPAAAWTPRPGPGVAADAWPILRDGEAALRLPPAAEKSAANLHDKNDAGCDARLGVRHGLLDAANQERPRPWLRAFVAANPTALAALRAARPLPGFRAVGADQLAPPSRWEEYDGLGALAIAAMRVRAADRPSEALGHAADGVGLGARVLLGGGPADRPSGGRVLAKAVEATAREWPRLVRADDAALAAFARRLDAHVPPGDAPAWVVTGLVDRAWRDLPAIALRWRSHIEAEDPTFALLFARPLAAMAQPRTIRVARAMVADVGARVLAGRRAGRIVPPGDLEVDPFRSQAWQLVRIYGATDEASASAVVRAAGVGALSLVLHPDEWAAWMIANQVVGPIADPSDEGWRVLARLDGLRVRVALERHRRRTGAVAADFRALVPADLAVVPRDPFAPGRPYRWRAGRLWSVGPDAADPADDIRVI